MPLTPKVLQLSHSEVAADLARLHREHLEALRSIYDDPRLGGPHVRSDVHGRAILDAICETYRLRAQAIHDVLARSLRFQDGQPFSVDELAYAFEQLFEPERSKVLEHSRQRLAEIGSGSFINDSVFEANRLIAWFRTKAEHIAADHQPQKPPPTPKELLKEIRGSVGATLGPATLVAYGRSDSREELARAAEVRRELERLHTILPAIPDRELSAYSTKSLSIATYLHHQGHAFSVLTEDMLAEAFKDELKRREADRREGWNSLRTPRYVIGIAITAVLGVLGVLAKCSPTLTSRQSEEPRATVSPPSVPDATTTAPTAEATGNARPHSTEPAPTPGVTIAPSGAQEVTAQPATAEATEHAQKEVSEGTAR